MGTMCKVEGSLCLNRHSARLWGPHQANVLTSRSPIYKTRIALHNVHACTHTHITTTKNNNKFPEERLFCSGNSLKCAL